MTRNSPRARYVISELSEQDRNWYFLKGYEIRENKFLREFRLGGSFHREDGPAKEYSGGAQGWFQHDRLHRTDGPAYITTEGTQYWYLNGERHREDGPAIVRIDGYQEWWLNGKRISYRAHKEMKRYVTS